MVVAPLTVGVPLGAVPVTVVEHVLEQPVVLLVKVSVAEPQATPVTTPALVTVAIPVLLLDQVPPEVGEAVHVLLAWGLQQVTEGNALTVIVAEPQAEEPQGFS